MKETSNKYLISAVLLAMIFHGSAIFFTLETTYDALIHLFFAEHYADNWFEPWSYKWYTGFTVMSYPPLVHQSIALLSLIGGLKFGMFTVALIVILLFVTGVYRFSLVMTSHKTASGYAALLAVFSSSFVETLHIFGQLPSIVGISILMHALPELYRWIKTGKLRYFATSLTLISVTVTSHHVTPIFGMVFFIAPMIGMVVMDEAAERSGSIKVVRFKQFIQSFFSLFKRIIAFCVSALTIIVICILPYWINSKQNPITQVPIPHGSRDNFLEITSSGLVFFLIPWGMLLILLPYIFYRYYSKRYIFFGICITVLTVLGTGGTTPIPLKLLGETAFNILTLDRFTLWASIMSLPLLGEFAYRFVQGDLKVLIRTKFGAVYHRLVGGVLVSLMVFMVIFTMSLNYFRPSQPQKIDMLPIVNFLNQDQHDQWRYLTLGFGDQMAWLSAQTDAMTVDGNYHSARRLPELTTRPIERLENSKFKGIAGIGSLQQFLSTPEKYNLKYIFSNDKFYDPILFFCGWQRLPQLENGIMVWERLNVPPLSSILPKEDVSTWLKIHWGVVPMFTVLLAFIFNLQLLLVNTLKTKILPEPEYFRFKLHYGAFKNGLLRITHIWSFILAIIIGYGIYLFYIKNNAHHSPENVVLSYFDAIDFKEFESAFALMDPKTDMSMAQYMLEISVTDGLLSSYAKLDAIHTNILNKTDSTATIEVNTNWITPLEKLDRSEFKKVIKRGQKWYIEPEKQNNDLPPDQLLSQNTTKYFNQGRRRITTEQTYHEDVLRQPVLEVISARLVKCDSSFAIIGEIQNIDNVPADVTIKSTLYNDEDRNLASYNAKYHIKHKLMPKESSAFRINFEGIAWSKTEDSIPKTFDPDEFTPIELQEQPTKFDLQVGGNVAITDLYKKLAISKMKVEEQTVTGELFNTGLQEVTIPQLLISYYDENKDLLWVDNLFVDEGIRQQRRISFNYPFEDINIIEVINSNIDKVFVNSLPNASIAEKIFPDRDRKQLSDMLIPIHHPLFSFIKIETNAFIGNPK